MSRFFQRKGKVAQATLTVAPAGDTLDATPDERYGGGGKFRRDFERGYRKFWAKRGVDVTSMQW